jgi:hypothetical protein
MILLGAIILLFLTSFFVKKDKNKKTPPNYLPGGIVVLGTVLSFFGAYFVLEHEPLIDFRNFKVGNNIIELRTPVKKPIYEYIFTDSTGKELVFKDYPQDSTIKYKSYRITNPEDSLLFLPKILDYNFTHSERGDFTAQSLKGNKLLVILQNTMKSDREAFEKIKNLASGAKNVQTVVISADSEQDVANFLTSVGFNVPFYLGDEKVLKTIIRCNPGLMLLKDGIILGKWHHNDTPSPEDLNEILK